MTRLLDEGSDFNSVQDQDSSVCYHSHSVLCQMARGSFPCNKSSGHEFGHIFLSSVEIKNAMSCSFTRLKSPQYDV